MNARIALLACLLCALSMPVLAQTSPDDTGAAPPAAPQAPHRGQGHLQERFDAADANHDGRLSADEAKAMPRVAKRFDAIDANHDGFVSFDELKAARRQMMAARKARQAEQAAGNAAPPAD